MNHHHHAQQRNPLTIMEMAEFDANLGEVSEEEKRRKRVMYLRDAVQQTQTGVAMMKGFSFVLIPFAIIPIFWPFLIMFWYTRKKTKNMLSAQLDSALEYWGIGREEIGMTSQTVGGIG